MLPLLSISSLTSSRPFSFFLLSLELTQRTQKKKEGAKNILMGSDLCRMNKEGGERKNYINGFRSGSQVAEVTMKKKHLHWFRYVKWKEKIQSTLYLPPFVFLLSSFIFSDARNGGGGEDCRRHISRLSQLEPSISNGGLIEPRASIYGILHRRGCSGGRRVWSNTDIALAETVGLGVTPRALQGLVVLVVVAALLSCLRCQLHRYHCRKIYHPQ